MRNFVRAALAIALASFFALASVMPSSAADAADTRGTPTPEQRWYLGDADDNAYGTVEWNDRAPIAEGDMDYLNLYDDVIPPGYWVKMKVVHGSFEKTVSASGGGWEEVHIPHFKKGETAKFKACAYDGDDAKWCRTETITE